MELQATNFRPLVDSNWELAPYLAGLNVSEALEDFGRLADLILSPKDFADQRQQGFKTFDDQQQHQPTMATPVHSGSFYSYLNESASPGSPGAASLYSTTTTSSSVSSPWSQASSPLESDHSLSCSSFASSSPGRHCSLSAASSVCGDLDECHSSQRRSSRSRNSATIGGNRRRQNATAAERYRRKLRGRLCGLDEELDRERERNSKLMKSFEAKLELYREFADLLAANTRDPNYDLDLARLGSRSLENILERICPAEFLAQNDRQRAELERLREHFRRVLSVAPFYQRSQDAATSFPSPSA